MLENQFFNISYKKKWTELLGKVGLDPNNDADETVQKFLTARLKVRYSGCDIMRLDNNG